MDSRLNDFQRQKVRDIVGLSTDLHDKLRALSERRSSLMERKAALDSLVARAKNAAARRPGDEAEAEVVRLTAQRKEIEDALRAVSDRYEPMAREAQIAGHLADRLLQHLGLRADGDDVLVTDVTLPNGGAEIAAQKGGAS